MDITQNATINVLMFPWLAHGHISPFLELAKMLAMRGFNIYFCSTPINLISIKKRIPENYSQKIHLVDFPLPSSPELPPHYHTTNDLPPHLMKTLKHAFKTAAPLFSDVVLSINPDLIIYDFNEPWAAETASSLNIPAVIFLTSSAATLFYLLYKNDNQKGHEVAGFEEILSNPSDFKEIDLFFEALRGSRDFILIKTCREMEGKYIDILLHMWDKRVVPVGPLVRDSRNECGNDHDDEIMRWLEKREKRSVIFVAFGSEDILSKEDIMEVGEGLELSLVNFIWAVRFGKTKIEEVLPKGFRERVGNRGLVVEGWAPQTRILGHPSVGGFVSHCGWNSIMESAKFGVPIICVPMVGDESINSSVVEAAGVGVEAVRDENKKLKRDEIAKVIRKVVLDESGDCVRKRMKEMSESFRGKAESEIDGVVEELVKLIKREGCDMNGCKSHYT